MRTVSRLERRRRPRDVSARRRGPPVENHLRAVSALPGQVEPALKFLDLASQYSASIPTEMRFPGLEVENSRQEVENTPAEAVHFGQEVELQPKKVEIENPEVEKEGQEVENRPAEVWLCGAWHATRRAGVENCP